MSQVQPKPRALVVSHFYEPEPNFITADVAARLASEYDVTVIAPHPNYPLDHVYPGTRASWRAVRTFERGVTVWRLPILPYHGRSHLRRALCYLSFALPAALLAPLLARRPSLVWIYLGPLTSALAAIPFRLAGRARIALTCADLWPESLLAAGVARPGPEVSFLFACSRAANRLADAIVCSTRGIVERFARDGIPRDRLHYVPVWVPGATVSAPGHDRPAASAVPRIVYAGNLGPAQRLDTVILAAAELERDGVKVGFDLYGSGSEDAALRRLAEESGLTRVRFHGRVPPDEAFQVSASATGQLVSLEPSPLFAMTIPSKLSFCCRAGAPLLYGLVGEAAELAASASGGFPFDPASPASLARAVKRLLACSTEERAVMKRNLEAFYRAHFETAALVERCRNAIVGA